MRNTLALLVCLVTFHALGGESPLLSAKETQEAEDAALVFREVIAKYEVLQGLPPTTKRAEAKKLAETQASAHLKMLDAAHAKALEGVVASMKKIEFESTAKLILVPDFHSNEDDAKIIAALIDATPTDHFVALEGLAFGWKKGPVNVEMQFGRTYRLPADARVTGIESPDFLTVHGPHQMLQAFRPNSPEKERAAARKMLLQALVMGYGEDLLDVISEAKLSKAMARYLDPLKKKDLETVALAIEKGSNALPPVEEWKALATVVWARNCRYYYQKSPLAQEVKRLTAKIEKGGDDGLAAVLLWHLVAYELRNVTWTSVVSATYAKVAPTGESLYVVMGASHVGPMGKYLTEVLGPKGVKITKQFRKSHLDEFKKMAQDERDDYQKALNAFPE